MRKSYFITIKVWLGVIHSSKERLDYKNFFRVLIEEPCNICLSYTPLPRIIAPLLRVALHCEYTVPTCPQLSRSLSFVPVSSRLLSCSFFSLDWVFLISVMGNYFGLQSLLLQFVPRSDFLYSLFPILSTIPRTRSATA